MEEESNVSQDELVTHVLYKINREKRDAYLELHEMGFSPDDPAYTIMHLAKQAEKELEEYRKELDKKNSSLWHYRVQCLTTPTGIEGVNKLTMHSTYIQKLSTGSDLPFRDSRVTICLKLLPYFKRIITASEFETMRQQQNKSPRERKEELLKILLKE